MVRVKVLVRRTVAACTAFIASHVFKKDVGGKRKCRLVATIAAHTDQDALPDVVHCDVPVCDVRYDSPTARR